MTARQKPTKWQQKLRGGVLCCFVGDVDGDGENEVVAGSRAGTLRVFSGAGTQKWQQELGSGVRCCFVGDVDGDGENEVVAGSEYGALIVFSGTGTQKW
ncbi:MAG: FG-GAP repeat domain-containing protein, partial [Candidatus Freyarchaeota archaeon]